MGNTPVTPGRLRRPPSQTPVTPTNQHHQLPPRSKADDYPPIVPVGGSQGIPLDAAVSSGDGRATGNAVHVLHPSDSADAPVVERVAGIYVELAATAKEVNEASDELRKVVDVLETALERLNLGVETWVQVSVAEFPDSTFEQHLLGYVKLGKQWKLALKASEGPLGDENYITSTTSAFNDAPRFDRVRAVEKFPDLFEQLVKQGRETAAKIKHSTTLARDFADAIHRRAPTLNQTAPRTGGSR